MFISSTIFFALRIALDITGLHAFKAFVTQNSEDFDQLQQKKNRLLITYAIFNPLNVSGPVN